MLPTTQFAYRKGLGTCDVIVCVSHTLQSAVESGQEARIVHIDFSAGFDRVNYQGILNKLCSVGIRSSLLSILTQFLRTDNSTFWWTHSVTYVPGPSTLSYLSRIVILSCPRQPFTPSIQLNLGLPRTRPALLPSTPFWPYGTRPFFSNDKTISILCDRSTR